MSSARRNDYCFSHLVFSYPIKSEGSSTNNVVVLDKDLSTTEEEVVVEQQSVPKESPPSIIDLLGVSPAQVESGDVSGDLTTVSDLPSLVPTLAPFDVPIPIIDITSPPTAGPTMITTVLITFDPTSTPTNLPSEMPSDYPSEGPSTTPTVFPSVNPTAMPSDFPSDQPSGVPSSTPSTLPSQSPSVAPSPVPTAIATVFIPFVPAPTEIVRDATGSIESSMPSDVPSDTPSNTPSAEPTETSSQSISDIPSQVPTAITTVFIPFVQAPTSEVQRDAESSLEETILQSDFPSTAPKVFDEPTETTKIPNMVSSEASIPSMTQTSNSEVPSDVPSQTPSDMPSQAPSESMSDMPSDMPSQDQGWVGGSSDVPSSIPAANDFGNVSDIPSSSPSLSIDLSSSKFMDKDHIELFEDICANDFLREYLPWVQSADYKAITCSVISQKETLLNRRSMQTDDHRAQITYRTNGIDILVLVSGIVDLPQGVSFQSVVVKTFVTFKNEFQGYLSSASSFFVESGTTPVASEGVVESNNGQNILGATTVWYIVAAALIAGGFLALSISFFVLSRREDEASVRISPDAKDDASSHQLSIKVSDDDMLPPTPVGLDAMRPPALNIVGSGADSVVDEVADDDSSTSGSKSEPSLTMLSGVSVTRPTSSFDQIVGKYSPHAGKREIPEPAPPSPRLSLVAEEHPTDDRMLPDLESQDQSTDSSTNPESSAVEPWSTGWRRMWSFGKRKRSIEIPPLQQQRDDGLSSTENVAASDLTSWTQGSLGKQKVFDHVLTDLDKLARKKSSASTPKYDNTSGKPHAW